MENRVKEIYNRLHSIPEGSGCEEQTSAYLALALEKAGYETTRNVGGHGVIGVLKGAEKGVTVGLRADMDALMHNIDGKITPVHSCGHDANCSMGLVAAENIAKKGIKKGTVKIIFQPAEETITGAKVIIDSGYVNDLDYLIGIHLRPIQEAKMGQATPALNHGASSQITAAIIGTTAHGARPHLGVNPIDVAALVVNAVNAIHENPIEAWSAKTTRFVSNSAVTNAIPDRVDLAFDLRSQSNSVMDSLITKIKRIIEELPIGLGATGKVDAIPLCPGADYDKEVIDILGKAIVNVMGAEALLEPINTPGADDFHFYKKLLPHIKTGFIGLGADLTPGLHNPQMNFNKDTLPLGVRLIENAITTLLNKA